MELLAPAGSIDSLRAAVQSGADAVYLGGSRFSARSFAKNFELSDLKETIDYCHLRGVKVHIAANTLIKENETDDFIEYIGEINRLGADAVIIQDFGMAKAVIRRYPDLAVHASTQMTCASLNTAKMLEAEGFSRIVLARELDERAIEKIVNGVNTEIEVFVHGAICMSYSGQCLMSSMIGGRSGNRGMCAQPCRLPYNFYQNGKNVNKGYLLSPKDMCLVNNLNRLCDIGVNSLKIEGRLKRSEYVSAVVGIYRKCIDEKRCATDSEFEELKNAFNRSGFTDGYFAGNVGRNMMTYKNPSNISENKFSEEAIKRCETNTEIKKIPVSINAKLEIGKPLMVTIGDFEGNSCSVSGEVCSEVARNRPIDAIRIEEQVKKMGQTPFLTDKISVTVDDGIILPIGEINAVRRKAVLELCEKRTALSERRTLKTNENIENIIPNEISLSAKVRNIQQAKVCIHKGIKRIYAPYSVICELSKTFDEVEFVQTMPPIDKEGKNECINSYDNILINSLGQTSNIEKKYFADYRMNVFNSYSLNELKGFSCVTLSPELTINEIKNIKKPVDTEIIAYGRIPLMTFENCPVRANSRCEGKNAVNELIDRKNERFLLMCADGCFSELLNSKPIYMADKLSDLTNTGVRYLRLDFTDESTGECERILSEYQNAMKKGQANPAKENTFTRGHFYKKID